MNRQLSPPLNRLGKNEDESLPSQGRLLTQDTFTCGMRTIPVGKWSMGDHSAFEEGWAIISDLFNRPWFTWFLHKSKKLLTGNCSINLSAWHKLLYCSPYTVKLPSPRSYLISVIARFVESGQEDWQSMILLALLEILLYNAILSSYYSADDRYIKVTIKHHSLFYFPDSVKHPTHRC